MIHWVVEQRVVTQDEMIKHINFHATDNYYPEDYLCFKFSEDGKIIVYVRESSRDAWVVEEDLLFSNYEEAFLYAGRLIDRAVAAEV